MNTPPLLNSRGGRGRMRGVSLIEMMIGLGIGMLILLAALSLMLNLTHASAAVAQTQDVADIVRSSIQYMTRRVGEAGFGVRDPAAVLTFSSGSGTTVGNNVVARARLVVDPMSTPLPPEIVTCTYDVVPKVNDVSFLQESCDDGTAPRPIVTGVVAFEAQSGCSVDRETRVAVYRRGQCVGAEVRRSVRLVLVVRAALPDPVRGRLVADDTYRIPETAEVPAGALYTVPTGAVGAAQGCDDAGDCRRYKHRTFVTEVVPRNELLRESVAF